MRKLFILSSAAAMSAFTLAACSSAMADVDQANLAGAGDAFTGENVVVEDFIGTLVIKTGPGMERSVSVENGVAVASGELKAPKLSETRNGYLVRGDSQAKVKNCSSKDGDYKIRLKGHSKRDIKDFPVILMTAPSSIELDLEMVGGLATIGDVSKADLKVVGCGDVAIGDVVGEMDASVAGSGDINAGDVGALEASIRGSGDINVLDVAGAADMSIAGSGDIEAGRVDGSIDAGIAGSGDIRAAGGSGELDIGIRGSGDVRIQEASFSTAEMSIAGSGDIQVGGSVGDLDITIAGSGDIRVDEATGNVDVSRLGSGDIVVDGKRWTRKGWVKD